MSTDISGSVADRQRSRAGRRAASPNPAGQIAPPRQRRPALAALALLLIVGGALVAGLLAVRMDSRVPVLVAKQSIEPGAQITADDLGVVRVASEGLGLIGEEYADDVIGAYATTRIEANTLLDENLVSSEDPIPDGRAIVSVPLDGKLAPVSTVRSGDLVQVVRATSSSGGTEKAEVLGTAYVLEVAEAATDELGGSTTPATASLLVLDDVALSVIDAASAGEAGLAILESGQQPDIPLEGAPVTVYAFASAKGSPGVSTTVAAVAASWPTPVVLADVDPAGGDVMWRNRTATGGPLDPDRGLLSLGAAVRRGAAQADLTEHLQAHGHGHRRAGRPRLARPAGRTRARRGASCRPCSASTAATFWSTAAGSSRAVRRCRSSPAPTSSCS